MTIISYTLILLYYYHIFTMNTDQATWFQQQLSGFSPLLVASEAMPHSPVSSGREDVGGD